MKHGFSLIEVLVFVSVLALFFVVAVAVTTATIRNMQVSEHKIIATHYAEELSNWITSQKEADWYTFTNNYTSTSGKTYCFKDLSWSINRSCSGSSEMLNSFYNRYAVFTADIAPPNTTQVTVTITVSWPEPNGTPNGTHSVQITNVYQIWE